MSVETFNNGNEPELKVKGSRTPRDYSSIEKGALALGLSERVELKKRLEESIDAEVKDLETQFNKAKELVNGKP